MLWIGATHYYDDAMICFFIPFQVCVYTVIAILFFQLEGSRLLWLLYPVLMLAEDVLQHQFMSMLLPYTAGQNLDPITISSIINHALPFALSFAVQVI